MDTSVRFATDIIAFRCDELCLTVAEIGGDVDAATCAYGDKLAVWFENDGKEKSTNGADHR